MIPSGPARSPYQVAVAASLFLVGILLLSATGGLIAVVPPQSSAHATAGTTTPVSPSALLSAAHASAARGSGPWGPVSASPSAIPLSGGPNLTFGVIMTYDAADGFVVAVSLNATAGPFGNSYGPSDLTWKFAGGNWSLLNTTGQVPATLSPGLVYDAHDEYVLLYGGRLMDTPSSVAPLTNQTWSFHAGTWTNLSATSNAAPFAVDFANPVYDAADGYVVLFNEIGITPTDPNGYLNTTWTYAGGVWTNITATAGVPPQMFGSMTYDAADHYVLYFGGYTWWNQLTNSTWSFHGGVWTNISGSVLGAPSPRMNFGIAYDSVRGAVILYGGVVKLYAFDASEFGYDTWAYSGGSWTQLSSNGTVWSIQTMTYDTADSESVLLGANSSLTVAPNVVTWVYSSGSWVVAAPLFLHSQWVTDLGQPLALVVTQSPNAGGLTYAYSGLPPGCSGTNGPTVTCTPTSTGTYPVAVNVSGSAGFRASARALVVVNPAPSIIAFDGPGPIGEVGISAAFGVTAGLGTGALSYSYVGLPPGCASRNSSTFQCVPGAPGGYTVTAAVTDALGVTASAVVAFQVVPPLGVSGFMTNRTVLDIGEPLSVAATLSGGDGPFLYAYTGLPTGCASVDGSALTCRPTEVGAFSLSFSATDVLGAQVQGGTALLVNPLPSVVSVAASNGTISAGATVSVVTTIVGGTAPFQYQYSGLPSGCTAQSSPSLQCVSVPTGNYTIGVTVTDSTGATANGATTITALGAPPTKIPIPTKLVPTAGSAAQPGFWFGFGLALVAIAFAAAIGGRRVYLTRQGKAIVRELGAHGEPVASETVAAPEPANEPVGPAR